MVSPVRSLASRGKAAPKGALVGTLGCQNANATAKAASAGAKVTAITRGAQLKAQIGLAKREGVSVNAVSNVSRRKQDTRSLKSDRRSVLSWTALLPCLIR